MPEQNDQGTGKHPHKSTEEPYPQHEGKDTRSEHAHQTRGSGEREERSQQGRGNQGSEQDRGGQKSGSSDLNQREYRDAEGNVHHHTHTYEEQHGKEK